MTNPLASNSELSSVFEQIATDPLATEAVNTQASNKPIEISKQEIERMADALTDEEATKKAQWSNECELLRLCARGPHAAQYAVNVMGISELEADGKDPKYSGKKYPILVPEKPSKPWDGYEIRTPEGITQIPKSEALAWLINNTLGRIVGGDGSKTLRLVQAKNISLDSKKPPVTVKRSGLTAYNPDHVLDTYQEAKNPDGSAKTVSRSVPLRVQEAVENGEKITVRGKIENFPAFERKPEFIETLGTFGTRGGNGGVGKIAPGVDTKKAVEEYLKLVAVSQQAGLV